MAIFNMATNLPMDNKLNSVKITNDIEQLTSVFPYDQIRYFFMNDLFQKS